MVFFLPIEYPFCVPDSQARVRFSFEIQSNFPISIQSDRPPTGLLSIFTPDRCLYIRTNALTAAWVTRDILKKKKKTFIFSGFEKPRVLRVKTIIPVIRLVLLNEQTIGFPSICGYVCASV